MKNLPNTMVLIMYGWGISGIGSLPILVGDHIHSQTVHGLQYDTDSLHNGGCMYRIPSKNPLGLFKYLPF